MIRYRFPGFYPFLRAAAVRIGRPEAEAPARKIAALSGLADLCAQAGAAEPRHAAAIVEKAAGFRDQLRAAYEAAELILAETRAALDLPPEPAGAPDVPDGGGPGAAPPRAAEAPARTTRRGASRS